MSTLSKFMRNIIFWLLGNGSLEFLVEIARSVVTALENHDSPDGEEKRKEAQRQIREKLKALGRSFSSRLINLAIELVLVDLREEMN